MNAAILMKILLAIPLVSILGILAVRGRRELAAPMAVVSGIASLLVATVLSCTTAKQGLVILTARPWIEPLGAQLKLGLEPVGLLMIWIAAFSVCLGIFAAVRDLTDDKSRIGAHLVSIFVIQAALYVVFSARDLLLFFLAYETVLVPMFLLIFVWGGKNRVYASMKFLLMTLFGSLPMLLSLVVLGVWTASRLGAPTFDLDVLRGMDITGQLTVLTFLKGEGVKLDLDILIFSGFALAFLVKTPAWPLHTWLPDAHTEAPTSGSIILAGTLLKMGTYGLAAIAIPLFPAAAMKAAPLMVTFGLFGIILGALGSYAQTDAKRLIAYSSVSHMGFVVLGLFVFTEEAWLGAVLQMAAHGVATGVLFYFVGLIYRRRHDRSLSAFGGFATLAPALAVWAGIASLASMGLPGTAGFTAEISILYGTFIARPFAAALAAPAVILSAMYMLKFLKAVNFADTDPEFKARWDGSRFEELPSMVFCGLLLIAVGVAPQPLVFSWLRPAVIAMAGAVL